MVIDRVSWKSNDCQIWNPRVSTIYHDAVIEWWDLGSRTWWSKTKLYETPPPKVVASMMGIPSRSSGRLRWKALVFLFNIYLYSICWSKLHIGSDKCMFWVSSASCKSLCSQKLLKHAPIIIITSSPQDFPNYLHPTRTFLYILFVINLRIW